MQGEKIVNLAGLKKASFHSLCINLFSASILGIQLGNFLVFIIPSPTGLILVDGVVSFCCSLVFQHDQLVPHPFFSLFILPCYHPVRCEGYILRILISSISWMFTLFVSHCVWSIVNYCE